MLLIQGAPGSPYTRKMLGVLRYKHIPYRYITRDQAAEANLPRPKVELLPTLFFPRGDTAYEAAVDSTPLIRRLDTAFPARPILPPDPALAFLDALIEDYADEWLTKAMFHYRWHHAPDRAKAGTLLPLHHNLTAPPEQAAALKDLFTTRQVGRLRYVGSNPTTAALIEASYARFLAIFEKLLQGRRFLFGHRPAAADFAIYGQLTQLALFDPTSAALTLNTAPRVHAWVEVMEDMSGVPDHAQWSSRETTLPALQPLLTEIGRVYVPVLLANERALAQDTAEVEAVLDGEAWRQAPFPYHLKCLAELRRLYANLSPDDAITVDDALAGTGIGRLFLMAFA
jgi:glutathione S-transferase